MLEKANNLRYNLKMTCLDMLVPAEHLLRKIERTIDFSEIYRMAEYFKGWRCGLRKTFLLLNIVLYKAEPSFSKWK